MCIKIQVRHIYLFDFILSLDAQVQVISLLQQNQWWTKLKILLRRTVRKILESRKDCGDGQEAISSLCELVAILSPGNHSISKTIHSDCT